MQHIRNDIKQNTFSHAYLLFGEERYLKNQYTAKLKAALCGSDEMNVHTYSGKDIPVGEIIDLAETIPFLADRRVILISDSGLFKSGGEKLAEYLSSPSESAFFIFTESEVDKRSKLYKTVHDKGYAAEFPVQDEKTLLKWIAGSLAKENKNITERTALLFLGKTGTDMENIRMELEKLICYCMDRDVITDADVEAICTERVSNHIYVMIDLIADGRTRDALQMYYDLLSLKVAPLQILFLIARQCNMLLQTKKMRAQGFDQKAIAAKLGIPPFAAGKYLVQAGRFKTATLRNALEQCLEAESAVKSGRMNDRMSVEILILTVLNPKTEQA